MQIILEDLEVDSNFSRKIVFSDEGACIGKIAGFAAKTMHARLPSSQCIQINLKSGVDFGLKTSSVRTYFFENGHRHLRLL